VGRRVGGRWRGPPPRQHARPGREVQHVVDVGDVVLDGLEAWREEGNSSGTFAEVVEWTDPKGEFHSRLRDKLVREAKETDVDDGVQQLARTFRRFDSVVDAVAQVKRMINAGTSWSAEQIQAAVDEAGYDIDVEEAARPDFASPKPTGSAALLRDISILRPFIRPRATVSPVTLTSPIASPLERRPCDRPFQHSGQHPLGRVPNGTGAAKYTAHPPTSSRIST